MGRTFPFFLLAVIQSLLLTTLVFSADVNVDDENSSVSYSPSGSWSEGNGCSTCALHPDSSNAFDGSWHDTTFQSGGDTPTITLSFTGKSLFFRKKLSRSDLHSLTILLFLSNYHRVLQEYLYRHFLLSLTKPMEMQLSARISYSRSMAHRQGHTPTRHQAVPTFSTSSNCSLRMDSATVLIHSSCPHLRRVEHRLLFCLITLCIRM